MSARIASGTAAYRKANVALFLAGFATFSLLYCVQPLLPSFARDYGIAPAHASLALSVSTFALAFCLLVAGPLSEVWGRKTLMATSLSLASVCNVLCATAVGFPTLLVWRALEGVALSGLPAVAMAYLGEEFEPLSLGAAMGLYVAGTAIGGMCGRLLTGWIADVYGWRAALAGNGALGIAISFAFVRVLPASRHFAAQRLHVPDFAHSYRKHFRDAGLPWLYATAFLAMGSFVTVYNYIAFRLLAAPYALTQTAVGAVFAVYLVGIVASTWMGRLADRFGRRKLLWIAVLVELVGTLVTLARPLPLVVLGIAIMTFGFFGAHSLASSWVGRRALEARAQASSLYLFSYYAGSTVVGTLGGLIYAERGWSGLVAMTSLLLSFALAIALRLRRLRPVSTTFVPEAILT